MTRFRLIARLFPVIVALTFSFAALTLSSGALAQTEEVSLDNASALFQKWENEAARADETLRTDDVDPELAQALREQLDPVRIRSRALLDAARTQLAPLQEQLDALGPAPAEGATEDASVAAERTQINARIEDLNAIVSKSQLAFTRADRLIATATEAQRRRFTNKLLQRGPVPLDPRNWVITANRSLGVGFDMVSEATSGDARAKRAALWSPTGIAAIAAVLFAFLLIFFARRYALRRLSAAMDIYSPKEIHDETELSAFGGLNANGKTLAKPQRLDALPDPVLGEGPSRARRLLVGVGVTLTRLILPIAALAAVRYALEVLELLGPKGSVAVDALTLAAAAMALMYALIYAFFAPTVPSLRLSALDDKTASKAAWFAMMVGLSLALDIALIGGGEKLDIPIEALTVVNFCIIVFGALYLWRFARIWGGIAKDRETIADHTENPGDEETPFADTLIRTGCKLAYVISVAAPLAAAVGYFGLSRYIFQNAILSAAVVGVAVVLFLVAREGSEALYEVAGDTSKKEPDGKSEQRLGLLPVFVGFVLSLLAAPVLALVWGATMGDLEEVYFGLTEGFTIGDSVFRPGDLLIAAFVFGLGLFVTRLLQALLRRAVMPRTRLDVGARSSIVSGLGYLGFFVSGLLAVSVGGIDLTNLAFLGAALGVGIGFGLQNIVNNFVSGVILLIERPIKVGDWIEVANTHGTVKKINVRSTEIQTFDKASYIVPNSELISGAVTNFTHGDLMGRAICPVGVDYGTDVRKVEKVLLEIARAHPMVLRRPPPVVVFQGFGASSLDFELRVHLRDVNWVLTVRSDINFEIDRRFREEKIAIPFAQTEVSIKNLDQALELVARSANGGPSRRPSAPDTDGD